VGAGQHSEAEEWLSRLVTAEPDDAEARDLFGSLLEAKGDTAGAALQYSRALELLLAHPHDESPTQPASLYAKVKELAPASPLVAKWASTFSPKPQASVPAIETPVSAEPTGGIDPETHYTLGVAYKNMGLLDEAKEEFCLSMQSHDFFSDSCLMIAVCLKEQGECQSASAQLELLLKDSKCQGAKAQAIRYELGLLYEAQELWNKAVVIDSDLPRRTATTRISSHTQDSNSAHLRASLRKLAGRKKHPHRSRLAGVADARCSNRSSSKAAASEGPRPYPLGYVEGLNNARTLLAACFSILLVHVIWGRTSV
jgi:tetratricopeptide (TPR) repeat protein